MKPSSTAPLTLSQGLVDEVTLGLQLGDQGPAFQELLQLLQPTETQVHGYNAVKKKRKTAAGKLSTTITVTDREVELLCLLLIGAPFGQAGLAEVRLAEGGLDRLHAVAVVEALGDIVILHRHHVVDSGQSGLHGLFHLGEERLLTIKRQGRMKQTSVFNYGKRDEDAPPPRFRFSAWRGGTAAADTAGAARFPRAAARTSLPSAPTHSTQGRERRFEMTASQKHPVLPR